MNGTELVSAVENLNYKGGNTRTGAGLKFVADNFFNPSSSRDVPKVGQEQIHFVMKTFFDRNVFNIEHFPMSSPLYLSDRHTHHRREVTGQRAGAGTEAAQSGRASFCSWYVS